MEKFFDRGSGYGFLLKSVAGKKDPSKIYYVLEAGRKNEVGKWYPDWAYKANWDKNRNASVPANKAFPLQAYLGDLGQARKLLKDFLTELSTGLDPGDPLPEEQEQIPF